MNKLLKFAFVLSLFLGSGLAAAQALRYAGADPTAFGSVNVDQGITLTRTIGVLSSTDSSQITALTVSGPGFTHVGGTCVPGFVVSSLSECTVQMQFAPGTVGPASGSLFVNCTTASSPGGVTILCDGAGGSVGLIGSALASLATAVPAVSSTGLTVLSLLLLGAMLITLHRQRHR